MGSTAADALDRGNAFRQALAVAIVKSKRRCTQEAAEWRSKAQKLETELEKQQSNQAELRQWLSSVLPQEAPCLQPPVAGSDNRLDNSLQHPGIFLPPLDPAGPGSSEMQQFPLHYASLQQQLARAAAAAGEQYGSVADVLDGKAAALTTMLLTNVRMLQLLQPQSAPHTAQQGPSVRGQVADTVSCVASFITSTLLHAPKSLLSTAYMKQCAALIAAVLAAPEEHPAAAAAGGCSVQTTQLQEADSPAALAVLVVQLMQQLLECRAAAAEPAQPSAAHASTGSGHHCPHGGGSSLAVSAAASTMLQQLSTFPGTALLLCLAAAQRLQCQVQKLLATNAAVLGVGLHNFSTSAGAGEQALLVSGQVFQASHELLLDLVSEGWTFCSQTAQKLPNDLYRVSMNVHAAEGLLPACTIACQAAC